MKLNERKDIQENRETLNFLIEIKEMLNSENAILGRNSEMFVLDTSKAPLILKDENVDIGRLIIERKLVADYADAFGVMNIVTGVFTDNNLLFCDVAESLTSLSQEDDEFYPYHKEVRNWFLGIPELSKRNKVKYETKHLKIKTEIKELMFDHAREFYMAIFSDCSDVEDQIEEKKLH